ncbi:MAG: hypothetical protein GY849_15980 [Deltaproteobacteria bacterium]|nr:hypothetical protein [Deltaproteobacteria bacterium]
MRKSCLSMLKGRVRIPGDANIKPGGVIEVKGVGDRFNGKTYVTGVRHQVSIKGWQTDMQFGLSSDWFSQRHDDIVDIPAAGLVPAVHGLQVGVVEAFEEDPEKKFRVRVRIPAMDAGRENPDGIIWARLASLDAGDKRGIFFRPEKGDEVVLGFLNDDPRQPVILGSMHSDNNALPPGYEITKENNTKGILTRGSLKIMLNDEKDKECIEISTPKSNLIRLSDKDKGFYLEDENKNKVETNDKGMVVEDKHKNKVTLDGEGMKFEDKNKNEVTMNSSGIVLQDKSGNKIVAQAGGINIETGSNITIKGNMVTIEGAQVNVN